MFVPRFVQLDNSTQLVMQLAVKKMTVTDLEVLEYMDYGSFADVLTRAQPYGVLLLNAQSSSMNVVRVNITHEQVPVRSLPAFPFADGYRLSQSLKPQIVSVRYTVRGSQFFRTIQIPRRSQGDITG